MKGLLTVNNLQKMVADQQKNGTRITATGKHKNKLVTVVFLGGERYQFESGINLAKLKKPETRIVYWLPARFKAEGLPYELEFTLGIVKPKNYPKQGARFEIIECTRKDHCPNGFTNSDIPIYLLRSLAIKASTFLASCTPVGYKDPKTGAEYLTQINILQQATPGEIAKDFLGTLEGELLYQEIGRIWRNSAHGLVYKNIAEQFQQSSSWANKHIAIGKKNYPKFFKRTTTTTKQKVRKSK